jgi:hypothetical protein
LFVYSKAASEAKKAFEYFCFSSLFSVFSMFPFGGRSQWTNPSHLGGECQPTRQAVAVGCAGLCVVAGFGNDAKPPDYRKIMATTPWQAYSSLESL